VKIEWYSGREDTDEVDRKLPPLPPAAAADVRLEDVVKGELNHFKDVSGRGGCAQLLWYLSRHIQTISLLAASIWMEHYVLRRPPTHAKSCGATAQVLPDDKPKLFH
jgi:hypothetical protein